jgi:hypothetical protein
MSCNTEQDCEHAPWCRIEGQCRRLMRGAPVARFLGMEFRTDPMVPPDEVRIRQCGRTIGRIIGLTPNDKAQGSAACGASPGATGSASTEEM